MTTVTENCDQQTQGQNARTINPKSLYLLLHVFWMTKSQYQNIKYTSIKVIQNRFLGLFPKEITVPTIFLTSEFHPTKTRQHLEHYASEIQNILVQTLCNCATSVASLTPKKAMTFWMPPVSDVHIKNTRALRQFSVMMAFIYVFAIFFFVMVF